MASVEESNVAQAVEDYIANNKVMVFSKTTCESSQEVQTILYRKDTDYFALELDTLGMMGLSEVPSIPVVEWWAEKCNFSLFHIFHVEHEEINVKALNPVHSSVTLGYVPVKDVSVKEFYFQNVPKCKYFTATLHGYGEPDFNELQRTKPVKNGPQMQEALAAKAGHSTVPQVYISGKLFGGLHEIQELWCKTSLWEEIVGVNEYEYDVIVIGGGAGGLSASKEAAKLGKKVALLDFVTPTPGGTSWGLGGTSVNVGSIPKKLMHQAALLGQAIKDAKHYGWNIPSTVDHNWTTMCDNIQKHISSLNLKCEEQLRSEKIHYVNAYARFIDRRHIKATDKDGKETVMSSTHFIIATGQRPMYPDIEGAIEFGITSDDLFSLKHSPGKTLVVGATYVALEFAGFLAALGLDVTIMVHSILLRGYDQDIAEKIGSYMMSEGIKFIRPCIPLKVEKIDEAEHKLKVTGKMESGEEVVGDYDTVLFAIGRQACIDKIGLDEAGVEIDDEIGKIYSGLGSTTARNIFAVGDVVEGPEGTSFKMEAGMELTSVAIKGGWEIAQRLYYGFYNMSGYDYMPRTVLTPLEYGYMGYSEEEALAEYGENEIEVYHSNFLPLEWTVANREDNVCYVKLICHIPQNERVIGFHYLGPNAGEITQGFALGLNMRATKVAFDGLIGIHPTCAEIFTTLTVSKSSGKSTLRKAVQKSIEEPIWTGG